MHHFQNQLWLISKAAHHGLWRVNHSPSRSSQVRSPPNNSAGLRTVNLCTALQTALHSSAQLSQLAQQLQPCAISSTPGTAPASQTAHSTAQHSSAQHRLSTAQPATHRFALRPVGLHSLVQHCTVLQAASRCSCAALQNPA
jgi:hypothetical protein